MFSVGKWRRIGGFSVKGHIEWEGYLLCCVTLKESQELLVTEVIGAQKMIKQYENFGLCSESSDCSLLQAAITLYGKRECYVSS